MFGQVAPGEDYDLASAGQPIMGDNTLDIAMLPSGGSADLVRAVGANETSDTSGVDAGGDYVFSWRSGNQN